jgi:plastocyanin
MVPVVLMLAAVAATPVPRAGHMKPPVAPDYLPNEAASKVVSVTAGEQPAAAGITVLTQAVAIKETGPRETVEHFGEVYVFTPSFIAVHRDEPTAISFWNLQPDDEHNFMLVDPDLNVLMKVTLPPLKESDYVFTFHREGLFTFYCTMHQPAMSGQLLVLPPHTPEARNAPR